MDTTLLFKGSAYSSFIFHQLRGEEMMKDLADKMQVFAAKVEEIQSVSYVLKQQTGQIRGITEIITGISDQTNPAAEEIAASTEEMSATVSTIRDSAGQLIILMEEMKIHSTLFVI